jgi:ectoine hydroxylase-related dioxygenase (phytanoyl-CoA dioxygenase family)
MNRGDVTGRKQQGRPLSSEERRAWDEEGFFIRPRVFGERELAALRAAAERVAERARDAVRTCEKTYQIDGNRYCEAAGATIQFEHRPGSETIRVIEPFHHLEPAFDALIDNPELVEPMRELVGCSRVSLFTDKLNFKRPREGSRFRWHQDSPYWVHFARHIDRLPNVMLALDDASQRNGCLRIIAGSHRGGLLPGSQGEEKLAPLFTDPRCFDASREQAAEMPSGSLLFFSPHAVHGSAPNESDQPRRALLFTYQPGGERMFKRDGIREAGGAASVREAADVGDHVADLRVGKRAAPGRHQR